MDRRICILATLFCVYVFSAAEATAQPKAISSIWSLSGIGIGYEHHLDSSSFIQVDVKAEMGELFINREWEAGGTFSFSWNMIFASVTSAYGSSVNFYAGPGVIVGWTDDHKSPSGGLFGVRGRIGVECLFDRRISISASISPILAMHLSMNSDNELNMRVFRNGLTYGAIPEIGIKYSF